MNRSLAAFSAALTALLLAGCATARPSGVKEYYEGERGLARKIYEENIEAEPNSRALYLVRLATLDLDCGDIEAARDRFIEATAIMQNFEARGEFKALAGAEETKEYKGDPYEQMMALWFLGLTDYMLGDFDKALPSFKAAALADGGTTDERYRSDAAGVFLMIGKAYQAFGDREKAAVEFRDAANVYTFRQTVERVSDAIAAARSAVSVREGEEAALDAAYYFLSDGASAGATRFQEPVEALADAREFAYEALRKAAESKRRRESLRGQEPDVIGGYIRELHRAAEARLSHSESPSARSPLADTVAEVAAGENNLLLFAGIGRGPYKYRAGDYGEDAVIGRRPYGERHAEVLIDGRSIGCTRLIEDIHYQASTRGGRAMDRILESKAFFKGAAEAGAVLALSQASHTRGRAQGNWLIAGVALAAASAATRPEADVRSWETLPDQLQVLAAKVEPGFHCVEVRFFSEKGLMPLRTRRWENVEFTWDREVVLYARSTLNAPPGAGATGNPGEGGPGAVVEYDDF